MELDRWASSTAGHTLKHGSPTKTKRVCNSCKRFAGEEVAARLKPPEPQPEEAEPPKALTEAELDKLSKRQLRQHGAAIGVAAKALEKAQAGSTPKADMIKLVLASEYYSPLILSQLGTDSTSRGDAARSAAVDRLCVGQL